MSTEPKDVVGKVCKSLEKYFDARTGKIRVKSRPVLVIGYEDNYNSKTNIDYEILPISKVDNTYPHPTYDYLVDGNLKVSLNLNETSYIRTHKTTWNHVKHMDVINPIGDLKSKAPEVFNKILELNEQWVKVRTANNIITTEEEEV